MSLLPTTDTHHQHLVLELGHQEGTDVQMDSQTVAIHNGASYKESPEAASTCSLRSASDALAASLKYMFMKPRNVS